MTTDDQCPDRAPSGCALLDFRRNLRAFMQDTSGAITTEWVMVTAVAVGLCLATALTIAQQADEVADETGAAMARSVSADQAGSGNADGAASPPAANNPGNGDGPAIPSSGTPGENRHSGDAPEGGDAPNVTVNVSVPGSSGGSGGGGAGGGGGGGGQQNGGDGPTGLVSGTD